MAKLPEDVRVALEGLGLLKEKFLAPLSRLDQVLHTVAESYARVEDAEKQLEKIHAAIAEEQRGAAQEKQRAEDRVKEAGERFAAVQRQWANEEDLHKVKIVAAEKRLSDLGIACQEKSRECDQFQEEITNENKRLTELRERIKRAQTMEP